MNMRKKSSKFSVVLFFLSLMAFFACENVQEEYYSRPEWLEPPIYTQLEDSGVFTNYLALVDKANFTKQLKGAGFYTVFAPNDEAFKAYFTEKGYASVDDIDSITAKGIVAYSLTISPASYDQIDDFQDGSSSATPATRKDKAFKRTTFQYKWVYEEEGADEETRDIIDINSSPGTVGASAQTFMHDDYNQKNIPFFTTAYMAQRGISATDYNYFYPNSELTDFNVVDAQVVRRNMYAENGIIHVVNKVIEPLNNLEEILAETDSCSEFKRMLDKYIVEHFYAGEDFQLKYEQSSGVRKDINVKYYSGACINLNCENYMTYPSSSKQMDAQTEGYSLFAPTNEAMERFYNEKFFKFGYSSIDSMPRYIIEEFVNAHLYPVTVWPTRFDITTNLYGEFPSFDPYANVEKTEFGSNGVFYAVDNVQETNAFNTVLSDILLNPDYTLMYQALLNVELADHLKSPNAKFLLFLISNEQFEEAGLKYNTTSGAWEFTEDENRPDLGSSANGALTRLLSLHIVMLNGDEEYDLTSLEGGVIKTFNDEYIRFYRGMVFGSGNDARKRPRWTGEVDSETTNGTSNTLSSAILYSNGNIGEVLSVSSRDADYKATQMMAYLQKIASATYLDDDGIPTYVANCVYNNTSEAIKDVSNSESITVFLPNDAALEKAVADGVLKPIGDFANGALGPDVLVADNQALENFLKYHIIKSNIVVGDPLDNYLTTYRKLDDGTYARIRVIGNDEDGTLQVEDSEGNVANVVTKSITSFNILGNRAIVHVIDNYLNYNTAPEAVNDSYTFSVNDTVDFTGAVLENDVDLENDALSASLVDNVINGTLTFSANGTFTYVHDGTANTSDSFTYKLSDGRLESNTATVDITITDETE